MSDRPTMSEFYTPERFDELSQIVMQTTGKRRCDVGSTDLLLARVIELLEAAARRGPRP